MFKKANLFTVQMERHIKWVCRMLSLRELQKLLEKYPLKDIDNIYTSWFWIFEPKFEVFVTELGKLTEDFEKLVLFFPSTEKIEVCDRENRESWIVETANPQQWNSFYEAFDDFTISFKRLLGLTK